MHGITIVAVDYYMNPPTQGLDVTNSDFRGNAVYHVPIIRIFGNSLEGSKCCLHVHKVFPYIYIPYDGSEAHEALSYQIANSLDKAINVSLGQSSSNVHHVHKVLLVSGKPIYGYHYKEHQFFKIFFYNPLIVKKACLLLENGTILGKTFQPYEAHIPYILQFMIDYNLHGMTHIYFTEMKLREDIDIYNRNLKKTSVSEIEADISSEHITNKLEIQTDNLAMNPGLAFIWEDERQRRRNHNIDSQIDYSLTQREEPVAATKTHEKFRQLLIQKLNIANIDEGRIDPNASVYPIETPSSARNILKASRADSSSQSNFTPEDYSEVNTTLDESNVSFLQDEDDILNLLLSLGENREIEEGSILSQRKDDKSDSEESDNEADLSVPFVGTPPEAREFDDSSFLTDLELKIPQLDGSVDYSYKSHKKKIPIDPNLRRATRFFLRSKNNKKPDMPILERSHSSEVINDFGFPNHNFDIDESMLCETYKSKGVPPLPKIKKVIVRRPAKRLTPNLKLGITQYVQNLKILNKLVRNSTIHFKVIPKHNYFGSQKKLLRDFIKVETPSFVYYVNCKTNTIFDANGNVIVAGNTRKSEKYCKSELTYLEHSNVSDYKSQKFLPPNRPPIIVHDMIENESDLELELCKNDNYKLQKNYNNYSEILKEKQRRCLDGMNYSSSSDEETDSARFRKKKVTKKKLEATFIEIKPEADSSKTSALDATLIEEILECQYKKTPKRRERKPKTVPTVLEPKPGPSTSRDYFELNLSKEQMELLSNDSDNSTEKSIIIHLNKDSKNNSPDSKRNVNDDFQTYEPKIKPPSRIQIMESLTKYNIPAVLNEEPYYSDVTDSTGKMEVGHNVLKISSRTTLDVPPFHNPDALQNFIQNEMNALRPENEIMNRNELKSLKNLSLSEKKVVLTPAKKPPSFADVQKWLESKEKVASVDKESKKSKIKVLVPKGFSGDIYDDDSDESVFVTQCLSETLTEETIPKPTKSTDTTITGEITGLTPNNTFGFNDSIKNLQEVRATKDHTYLTIIALELHIRTRQNFKPDPLLDPIRAIFYEIENDVPSTSNLCPMKTGMIIVRDDPEKIFFEHAPERVEVIFVNSERELIDVFIGCFHKCDPDILIGYEVEMLSWGYFMDRCKVFELNPLSMLSRIRIAQKTDGKESNWDGSIPGRIVLDVWRLMRHEIALQSYTFENLIYHILHKRVPTFTFKDLTIWWENPLFRHHTSDYYLFRVTNLNKILKKLDLIGRTSELARLFGIQFFEVLSRGSQFRVESMMLRLAKPLNFIPISPSVQQRAHMRAPEFLPLILEPESKFYSDPVVVFDFQSLYPSMIIAYNYCFSTCLGRIDHLGQSGPFEFGAAQLKVPKHRVKKLLLSDKLNFSPCGVAFVKPDVVQGVLPRMLKEILTTRLVVKQAMKEFKSDSALQKILHSRQLGLKLIANVTYGYTAANFSGRMPCSEVGDSVVSKGRETLQRAIDLVDNNFSEWGGRVVYGDTDSMFVMFPGKSRKEAFKIGAEIAERVTKDNPSPVKLKMEKVYQPCILQTKKRYVGYMYESEDQKEPVFDAKGIETVRRDGCPASSKMLEKCLKMLFDHRDVSKVRKYVLRQFDKILSGRVSIQDLIFAKEYRGMDGYRPGACVPALELARKWTSIDRRNEPRRKQRVPYVIVAGPPGLPLIRLVRSPYELLQDSSLQPNAVYYITKVIIPTLNRCFSLLGVDVNTWYNEMPRKIHHTYMNSPVKKGTISHFFATASCAVCGVQSQRALCEGCRDNRQTSYVVLADKLRVWEQTVAEVNYICESCTKGANGVNEPKEALNTCRSLDCPVLFKLSQVQSDLNQFNFVVQLLKEFY